MVLVNVSNDDLRRSIFAGLAYTGKTQQELAQKLGISYNTLRRRLNSPDSFTKAELAAADKVIRWTAFVKEAAK